MNEFDPDVKLIREAVQRLEERARNLATQVIENEDAGFTEIRLSDRPWVYKSLPAGTTCGFMVDAVTGEVIGMTIHTTLARASTNGL